MVAAPGDRPNANPYRANILSRVAVQSKDAPHSSQTTLLNNVECPARHRFLCGLEHQPDPSGESFIPRQLSQHQTNTNQNTGVYVVTAGVRDSLNCGAIRDIDLLIVDGQRIDVGTQRHHPVAVSNVADHASATAECAWAQAGIGESLRYESGRTGLQPA